MTADLPDARGCADYLPRVRLAHPETISPQHHE